MKKLTYIGLMVVTLLGSQLELTNSNGHKRPPSGVKFFYTV